MNTSPAPAAPVPAVPATAARPGALRRARSVWEYRELLGNLVRKELQVKYKNSALGFAWSLLNPALYLVVFYVVFEVILRSGIPDFAIFLLAGLLPWTLFSSAVAAATSSIVSNSALVNKVWFPREVLPLAAIGAAFVNYLLQTLVLVGALIVFRYAPSAEYSVVLIPALVALLVLLGALALALAAVNVYVRDAQHLVELLLLAWFWFTPIIYPYQYVSDRLGRWTGLFLLNPLVSIVIAFQRAIYNRTDGGGNQILPDESVLWYLRNVGIVLAASCALLVFAFWLFGRLEDDFAEEL
jgi:ABC-2 type transport system permease protein